MISNSVQIDGGPQISGRWFNPKTGLVVNVRDALVEGDTMYVITDKGRFTMDVFQDFIQDEGAVSNPQASVSPAPAPVVAPSVQPVISNEIKPDTDIYVNKNIQPQQQKSSDKVLSSAKITQLDDHQKIIDNIFRKGNINLKLNFSIESDNFPVDELKMLKKYFDINNDDIALYISNNYITQTKIKDNIKAYVDKFFD